VVTRHNTAATGEVATCDPWEAKLAPLLTLFDILGRRWAMRVLWELTQDRATFRALLERAQPISSSVLTVRLRELREAGLIDHQRNSGYGLTTVGQALSERIVDLYGWLVECDDWPPHTFSSPPS
jgi:DNA-binding HxlR family transcriptional regulator